MPKPDHEPRTWCPTCGAVCKVEHGYDTTSLYAIKEPTIGTYAEAEIVKVFAERKAFREALEQITHSTVSVENKGACALVDIALAALGQ